MMVTFKQIDPEKQLGLEKRHQVNIIKVAIAATVPVSNPVLKEKPSSSKKKNAANRPDWVEEIESVSHLSQLKKQVKLYKKLKSDNNSE